MVTPTYGRMDVDWEERRDIPELRRGRVERLTACLEASELGAVLAFDFNNIRYMTGTHIGTWGIDKMIRFSLLAQGGHPILWDFGSAARHHQLQCTWLDTAFGEDAPVGSGARAGISTLRGAIQPPESRAKDVAKKVFEVLVQYGVQDQPLGVDIIELPVLLALQELGIEVADGQQLFLEAKRIKTPQELLMLAHAAMMVDAAYEDLFDVLRPGISENECVAVVSKKLYELGSEQVEGVNAISGERCAPHPHVYSDRVLRPGDPAFFDIIHSYNGYRTCYYRTFAVGSASPAQRDAYKICRELIDIAIKTVKPGVTTAEIVSLWPTAKEFGFPDEEAAFALQYGHGVGLGLWERPIFSRLTSFDEGSEVIEEGMHFALETYWPSRDGWGAARIEEQLIVTGDGVECISKFPAEELLVAGRRYFTTGGYLPSVRDSESHKNTDTPTGKFWEGSLD